MPLSAPPSLNQGHQDLLQMLVRAQHLSGKTGTLAEALAKPLQEHMEKEETIILPLLGILNEVAKGKLSQVSSRKASKLYSELENVYPGMLRGHQQLARILAKLKKVGAEEGHLTAVRFAEALARHAQEEEEVLYPAALLVGKVSSRQNGRR